LKEKFILISYTFVEDDHYAWRVDQFVSVVEQLQLMHKDGNCHCDIRAYNIVFVKPGSTLIDFNFGGGVQIRYPEGFNSNREIHDGPRHKDCNTGNRLSTEIRPIPLGHNNGFNLFEIL
jgi:hypothetical protein